MQRVEADTKMAVAVDACAESIRRAHDVGAEMLFVHHGMFWGKPEPVSGALRNRLKMLLDFDMALYACHLPLDRHPQVGNNARLADLLGLTERKPFGIYHGISIGWSGNMPKPCTLDDILAKSYRTVLHQNRSLQLARDRSARWR